MKKNTILILAFIFGFIIRSTDAINIIHELWHYAWANAEGLTVTKLEWSHIWYIGKSPIVTYGGYMGEFMMYGFLVLVFSIKKKPLSSFFLGILLVVWLSSFISADFNKYALRVWGNQRAVTQVLIMWFISSSIAWWIILKRYFKGGV